MRTDDTEGILGSTKVRNDELAKKIIKIAKVFQHIFLKSESSQ
jgi:hypothetical protein